MCLANIANLILVVQPSSFHFKLVSMMKQSMRALKCSAGQPAAEHGPDAAQPRPDRFQSQATVPKPDGSAARHRRAPDRLYARRLHPSVAESLAVIDQPDPFRLPAYRRQKSSKASSDVGNFVTELKAPSQIHAAAYDAPSVFWDSTCDMGARTWQSPSQTVVNECAPTRLFVQGTQAATEIYKLSRAESVASATLARCESRRTSSWMACASRWFSNECSMRTGTCVL
jgi:hypothetical protein